MASKSFSRTLFWAACFAASALVEIGRAQENAEQPASFESAAEGPAFLSEADELPSAQPMVKSIGRPAPAIGTEWQNPIRRQATQMKPTSPRSTTASRSATPPVGNKAAAKATSGRGTLEQAFALTKTASTEAEYTKVIQLCQEGMRQGVDDKLAVYARRLTAWTHNRRGECRADAGQTKEALQDFEAAIALDSRQWRAVHNCGVCRAMLGKHAEAIADFTRVIEMQPKFANAWFNRGEMHYEQKDFAAAVRDYSESLTLNPDDASALNSRGHAYYRMRRAKEAIADFTAAIEVDPTSAAALVNRGDLRADLGQFAAASKDYRDAIQANPQLGRAYQSAAWLMATCPDEKYRNAELAIEAAQKAIELDGGEDYRYLETLAAAQANAGEFEAASETQEKAMQAAPESVALVYKGRIEKFRAGRPHREPASKLAASAPPPTHRQ